MTLRAELAEIIDHREDQVLFVDLGPAGARGGTASSRGQANRTLFWILPASLAGYAGCNENFVLLTTGITGVLSFEL